MRTETWCLRLTKRGREGTYRTYLTVRDGMYLGQTPYRGSSLRFDSEAEAASFGDDLVRARRAVAYEVEHIPADGTPRNDRHTPHSGHKSKREPHTRT